MGFGVLVRRMKNPDAASFLVAMLGDGHVSGHAVDALAKRGDPAAIEALRPFADDKRASVSRAARRALKSLAAGH